MCQLYLESLESVPIDSNIWLTSRKLHFFCQRIACIISDMWGFVLISPGTMKIMTFETRSSTQFHNCTFHWLSTLWKDKSHAYLALPQIVFCNLPDSRRYMTRPTQDLLTGRRKNLWPLSMALSAPILTGFDCIQLLISHKQIIVTVRPQQLVI